MKITGIIPARYASTRFPGKPLIDIGGKTMIQRVYEQCLKSDSLNEVIVATDDARIAEHVQSFNGIVLLTSSEHQSGTDRCAEVVMNLGITTDVVINIQGDEPFIDPVQIDLIAGAFQNSETQIATLIKRTDKPEEVTNPNVVKAIRNIHGEALYFSRSPIPYRRSQGADITYYKHIGIYGYKTSILKEITNLPPGNLETAESLEQLRWLENGYRITLIETDRSTISIDTPDDLAHVEKMMKADLI